VNATVVPRKKWLVATINQNDQGLTRPAMHWCMVMTVKLASVPAARPLVIE
jgi:hypothetical protein